MEFFDSIGPNINKSKNQNGCEEPKKWIEFNMNRNHRLDDKEICKSWVKNENFKFANLFKIFTDFSDYTACHIINKQLTHLDFFFLS